ncbi:hypothetical protein DYB25_001114 [Aphanomyces astaci]|uniref:Pseudouridine synthase RsuA/RluA-like domain-containing protein n=1 Tax=Aphanomyces astaci TaxID=112090 RepID=A0A397BJH4_APHAT|nr:hypothetical protein DYB25_001114 [Aphanomyces astaci]
MARKRHRASSCDEHAEAVVRHALQSAVDAIAAENSVDLTTLTFRVRRLHEHVPSTALLGTTAYSSDIPLRLYHSKRLDRLSDLHATTALLLSYLVHQKDAIVQVDSAENSSRLVLYTRPAPPPAEVLDVTLPLEVLHQDDAIIVVVKPHDLPSVDGRDRPTSLHRILRSKYPNVRMVHRLDMETSGVMVAARTLSAAQSLNAQFRAKTIGKTYTAVVEGLLSCDSCVISASLAADPTHRVKQVVDERRGKPSETLCTLLLRHLDKGRSRVHLTPVTGRTHQLRVHMQSVGHAIVGDSLYASQECTSSRLCLHPTTLELVHPTTNIPMTFSSKPPF